VIVFKMCRGDCAAGILCAAQSRADYFCDYLWLDIASVM